MWACPHTGRAPCSPYGNFPWAGHEPTACKHTSPLLGALDFLVHHRDLKPRPASGARPSRPRAMLPTCSPPDILRLSSLCIPRDSCVMTYVLAALRCGLDATRWDMWWGGVSKGQQHVLHICMKGLGTENQHTTVSGLALWNWCRCTGVRHWLA